MFGYRMKYNRGVKVPEVENWFKYRTDIGQQDCRNVNYRYENLAPYITKRKILRLLPNHNQSMFNMLNRI